MSHVEEPVPVPAAEVGVWRRPVTSIATALALAAGVTVGFLTAPQGGVAGGGAPVMLSGQPGTGTAATPADQGPADATPADAAPEAVAEDPPPPADEEAPADIVAAPAAGDATPPPGDDAGAAPAAADPDPAASTTKSTAKKRPTGKKAAAEKATAERSTAAAKLPKIDHIWVVGIDAPLAATDGSYVGDRLLPRATELPKYVPASTDPRAGASALVAGREPSANAKTIVAQLATTKRSWRAYGWGIPTCTPDTDTPGGIPLLSFPTVTSTPDCADHVAGLADLAGDLRTKAATPAFSYIATDPTLDATALDDQLQQVVEPIRRSAAFKQAGLIVIVPTAAAPIAATGALVLSPFAEGSTSIAKTFGPYSLLRTFADLLGVDRPGRSADKDVVALGPDILTPKD